jgi:hypothetical protein
MYTDLGYINIKRTSRSLSRRKGPKRSRWRIADGWMAPVSDVEGFKQNLEGRPLKRSLLEIDDPKWMRGENWKLRG